MNHDEAQKSEKGEQVAVTVDGYHASTESKAEEKPRPKPDFWVGDHVEIAQRLLSDLTDRYSRKPVFDVGKLWTYREGTGLWSEVSTAQQSQMIQPYSGKLVATEKSAKPLKLRHSDITGVIQTAGEKVARDGFFAAAKPGVSFKNGFLQLKPSGVVLQPHSPQHRAVSGVEHAYDEKATAPRFLQFLDDLFRDDDDKVEMIAALQEFYGACLFGAAPRYQRCLVLVGGGDNGKSTLQDITSALFPADCKAAVPPQQWTCEYSREMLLNVRLNSVSELPTADLLRTEMFKAVITGDEIHARPIRESPFTFRPVAGHIFSANNLPGINDQSHGLWRRFIVIKFNRRFEKAEIIRGLADQIIKAESPGIIRWMVDGAERLARNEHYTIPTSAVAALDAWKTSCDSVVSFVEEEMVPASLRPLDGEGGYKKYEWMPAKALYHRYRVWCHDNGHKPVANRKFSDRMKEAGKASEKDRDGRWYPVKPRPGQGGTHPPTTPYDYEATTGGGEH